MSLADEIEKLKELHNKGILSDREFERAKEKILGATSSDNSNFGNFWHSYRRSARDRWLGGVCGGLGEFTPLPTWVWRVAFCAAAGFAGFGVILYILLWIFAPEADRKKLQS